MSAPALSLADALHRRKSVRGFHKTPLTRARLEELFTLAQRAPSWCNTQPWRVALTAPPITGQLSAALLEAARSKYPTPDVAFPATYEEPYQSHRHRCGAALYGAMGIKRDEKAKRFDAWLRNYEFFGAPHVAVVSRNRMLGEYATLDVGVWLGVVLSVAATMGIDVCPMAATAAYPGPVREVLEIPPDEVILFGLALGTEDPEVPANACLTDRDPLAANLRFIGF